MLSLRTNFVSCAIVISIALLIPPPPARATEPPADARTAVTRSLPFIAAEGTAWMKERRCVTCHQTTFLIWTHAEALHRGLTVDRRELDEWTNWSLVHVLSSFESNSDDADTLSQFLLGRDASSSWTEKPPQWNWRVVDPLEVLTKHLLKIQKPEGNWVAGGQSHNPPEIPTGWALAALSARNDFMSHLPQREGSSAVKRVVEPNDKAIPEAQAKGLAWFKQQDPKQNSHLNEALVVRLFVERNLGQPADADARATELLARQNADGGWSADVNLNQPSDAFATGQSLYALLVAGGSGDALKPALQRATKFLLTTQTENGSWKVSTLSFHGSDGRPARDASTDAVFTYWGTAWSTIALLHTLPVPAK